MAEVLFLYISGTYVYSEVGSLFVSFMRKYRFLY